VTEVLKKGQEIRKRQSILRADLSGWRGARRAPARCSPASSSEAEDEEAAPGAPAMPKV